MKKLFLILLSFLFLQNIAFAKIEFPKLTGRVVDNANILTSEQKQKLSTILEKQENETSNQIVVVTLQSLNGNEIADYGYQLGRYWKIGQKDKNNGVLLIVAMKERKIRIEVGYGLEGALTDKISHEIIEYTIKPNFKKGNYSDGIYKGTQEIIKAIKGEYKVRKTSKNSALRSFLHNDNFDFVVYCILIILFMFSRVFARLLTSLITGGFAAIFSLTILQSSILSLIIFLVVAILMFIKYKPSTKSSSHSSSSSWGSSSSSSFGGGFSSRSSFSSGGGSFGGGGASGGW